MTPSAENTYCNPQPIPQMPRGIDLHYSDYYGMFDPPERLSGKQTLCLQLCTRMGCALRRRRKSSLLVAACR